MLRWQVWTKEEEEEGGRGGGAEDSGKYRASLAISRKALIPRQEVRIALPSELDVEKKNVECEEKGDMTSKTLYNRY